MSSGCTMPQAPDYWVTGPGRERRAAKVGIWVDGGSNNRIDQIKARRRDTALYVDGDSQIKISDVDTTGSGVGLFLANIGTDNEVQIASVNFSQNYCGIRLWNIDGLKLINSIGSGFGSDYAYAIELHNVHKSVVSGVDVSLDRRAPWGPASMRRTAVRTTRS